MSRVREVSPIGSSRFERPYSPPKSARTSTATSPTTPIEAHAPFPFHFSKPSLTSTNTNGTYSTAPTSLGSIDALSCELKGCEQIHAHPDESSDWLDKYHDPDPYLEDTDECPDRATLAAVQQFEIYDGEGNSRSFGSLYEPGEASHQRQLIIFIRYFYCPACTLYVKALTEGIAMQDYFSIPIPTSIIIIGCGQPDIIAHYKKFTGCPWPIYADPSRILFKKLGMKIGFSVGRKNPEYMGKFGLLTASAEELKTLRKSLKDANGIRKRDLLRGGHPMQIGGEFLFENGEVLWCHRMTNYRNHAEIKQLRDLLQLEE